MTLADRRAARRLSEKTWRRLAPRGLAAFAMGRVAAAPLHVYPAQISRGRPADIYGRIGDLEVRLAGTRADIRRAQRLRYEVFYEEMAAEPSVIAAMRGRDEDPYDAICDHLLVVDTKHAPRRAGSRTGARKPEVVGTYRLLRQDVARHRLGFYTQTEYDIAPLVASMPERRFVELGRSCVLQPYRTKRTVELLWHGLWTYVRQHKIDVMIGCASFSGVDPEEHALPLSYLYRHALAPAPWRARAHADRYSAMQRLAWGPIDAKAALQAMPPLIKAYLRLGAWVGDGAVVDRQFSTTDVLIVLPLENIDPRYFGRFGAPDELKSRLTLDP